MIDLLGEQTGYQLTPTPSPRRNQPEFQGSPQPSHSVHKTELMLGQTNISEYETDLSTSSVQEDHALPANSHRESKCSIQGSPESADAAFTMVELRESSSRSSSRSSHRKSRKDRSRRPDLHAGGETEGRYPQALGDMRGHKMSGFTRRSTSQTSTPSPPPVPHKALQISSSSHPPHLCVEDLAGLSGIQEEKFPEASCTESLPDSSACHPRPAPSPRRNKTDSQESPQSSAAAPRAAHRKSPSRSSPDRTQPRSLRSSMPERRTQGDAHRRTSPAANPDVR